MNLETRLNEGFTSPSDFDDDNIQDAEIVDSEEETDAAEELLAGYESLSEYDKSSFLILLGRRLGKRLY